MLVITCRTGAFVFSARYWYFIAVFVHSHVYVHIVPGAAGRRSQVLDPRSHSCRDTHINWQIPMRQIRVRRWTDWY